MLTEAQWSEQLAHRLRRMRLVHLLSRREMGVRINIPHTTIKNYEQRYREPKAVYLYALSKYFGSAWVNWLMGHTDEEPAVVSEMEGDPDRIGRIS
jgi:transcriptional regulator with XRE-family HTH domain